MALGTALNARGALEIVIATVGLSFGVLNDASYTIVVIMAIVTSMMAPPLLRWLVRGWVGTPEEQERLQREEQMAGKVLLRPGRVLVSGFAMAPTAPRTQRVCSVGPCRRNRRSPSSSVADDGADRIARLSAALGATGDRNAPVPKDDLVEVVLAQAASATTCSPPSSTSRTPASCPRSPTQW
jgi:hypothetical protein